MSAPRAKTASEMREMSMLASGPELYGKQDEVRRDREFAVADRWKPVL